jgi:limonene-1,2-epoxide hydrolase
MKFPKKTKLLLISLFFAATMAQASEHPGEPAEVKLVRELISAYERQDWDGVADMFAEQGTLHSVMRSPFSGREIIRARLVQFHQGIESMELEILHIGKVDDVVIVERMDSWVMNGINRSIPAVGVLEFEDGKIKLWKEYYDLDTLKKLMSPDYSGE